MGEKSRATLLFNKTRVIKKGNKYRRTKVDSVPLKFKPLNPSDESPFLNYLLYKLTPKKKKKDTWITKVTAKFDAALREGGDGEEGDQGYTRTREREKLVMLDECGCERRVMVEESDRWQDRQESSCSYSSYRRGGGQRVVGYSYYGERNSSRGRERKYFQVRESKLLNT